MQAILLVGGFGTRLQPLTLTTPKQMLPVAGSPMIEHVVAGLVRHGVDRVILSLGYREEDFRAVYPDERCAGAELVFAIEPEPLGTAGAIRFAWTTAGNPNDMCLVANGDVITDLDVRNLLQQHRRMDAEATIHLIGVNDPSRYGVVVTDDDGRVLEFVEKPPSDQTPSRYINAGTYVMEPSVIDRIPERGPASVERETFPALAAGGTLWSVVDDSYWVDAGTPESYLQVQLDLLEGHRVAPTPQVATALNVAPTTRAVPTPVAAPTTRAVPTPVAAPYVAPDVNVGAGANIDRSVVMSGATIGSGARIGRSVVMGGARIGIGARIEGSVVMNSAVIGAYAMVNRSVIGRAASLGPGSRVTDISLVGAETVVGAGEKLSAARLPDLK